jgi:hypothetical protein
MKDAEQNIEHGCVHLDIAYTYDLLPLCLYFELRLIATR